MSRRGLGLAVLALAACLLATACGSSEDETSSQQAAPAASDMRPFQTASYTFATPSGWQVANKKPTTGAKTDLVTEADGPTDSDGVQPQVVVGATPNYQGGLNAALSLNDLDAKTRYPQRRVVKTSDVDVPGASAAKLIESELPAGATGGAPHAPVTMLSLVAISKNGTAVNLFARAPSGEIAPARVREIVSSLELKG